MIDLHHIFALHFDGASFKMAVEALAVFELFIVNIFMLMATSALGARSEFFKLSRPFATMACTATDLTMLPGQ